MQITIRILASAVGLLCFSFVLALAQPTPISGQDNPGWERVDTLKAGTKIAVILKSGDKRIGYFSKATVADVTITARPPGNGALTQETFSKANIESVTTVDSLSDGAGKGALAGAASLLALAQASSSACGLGCENDAPAGAALGVAIIGAGIGSVAGLVADRLSGGDEVLYPMSGKSTSTQANRYFSTTPTVRFGPIYRQTTIRSSLLDGTAPSPGFAFVVQLSRYFSGRVEYTAPLRGFRSRDGSVPDNVLNNLVPATSRAAGFTHGIESRRVAFIFSELVGIHPPPMGRLRLELLVGLGVQGQTTRDYYNAYQEGGPIPGKYYVLDFESAVGGLITGVDAEVAVTRRLSIVPSIRYHHFGDPAPSIAYGVSALWRF